MNTPDLPDCPKYMECPILQERMADPVVAKDHHTYERTAIESWFDTCQGNTTSPLTRALISSEVTPNQSLKTQIGDWVDEQRCGKAAATQFQMLQGSLFTVKTAAEALKRVSEIGDCVANSAQCLLGLQGIARIKNVLQFANVLTDEVSAMLVVLTNLCHDLIRKKREIRDSITAKCVQLETITDQMGNHEETMKKQVVFAQEQVVAAESKMPAVRLIIQEYNKALEIRKEAQRKLDDYNESVTTMKKVHSEFFFQKEMVDNELNNVEEGTEPWPRSGGGAYPASVPTTR